MQGISNCRLCISKVLHGGVHPRVLHFAMSETPSTRGHYQGGCGSLFFRAHYPRGQVPWSRLFIMSASTAVRAGKNASIRMQWGAAEIFQQRGEELLWSLFLTRENAKAFQRCHFRGTKKKKESWFQYPLGISLAFLCRPRYAWSNPHHQEPIVILYFSSEPGHSITSERLTAHTIHRQFLSFYLHNLSHILPFCIPTAFMTAMGSY